MSSGPIVLQMTPGDRPVLELTPLRVAKLEMTPLRGRLTLETETSIHNLEVMGAPMAQLTSEVRRAELVLTPPPRAELVMRSGVVISNNSFGGIGELTGDVTAVGPGTAVATLADSGVTPGSYVRANITVDDKGRVTAAEDGGGGGDMLKSVYDPQNAGFISGNNGSATAGGVLKMQGGANASANGGDVHTHGDAGPGGDVKTHGGTHSSANGGDIDTSGGSALLAVGGTIHTRGTTVPGGSIDTRGGSAASTRGGVLHTHGGSSSNARGGDLRMEGSTLPGGDISTWDGGGSIDTRGTGSIGFGVAGTRTTVTGTATADRAISLPNKNGTIAVTTDIPSVANFNTFIHPPATSSTSDNTANPLPVDDTIPQSGEGKEYLTVTVTPKNASSTLIIDFSGFVSANTNGAVVAVALFEDAIANALPGTNCVNIVTAAQIEPITLRSKVSAGSTASRTYKIRFGPNTGTGYMLRSSATEVFSTSKQAVLSVTEILP